MSDTWKAEGLKFLKDHREQLCKPIKSVKGRMLILKDGTSIELRGLPAVRIDLANRLSASLSKSIEREA